MAPVLPLSAALAGRLLGGRLLAGLAPAGPTPAGPTLAGRLKSALLVPLLLVVLLGYLLGLAWELSQPPVAAQNQQLTSWLAARHLHTGLSGYWESNVVTLTSGERVQIRLVTATRRGLVPRHHLRGRRSGTTRAVVRRTSSCSSRGWRSIRLCLRAGRADAVRQARTNLPRRCLHDPGLG